MNDDSQMPAAVKAALARLHTARAHGAGDHERVALKELAALGYDERGRKRRANDEAGQARAAAAEASSDEDAARTSAPKGRITPEAKRATASGEGKE